VNIEVSVTPTGLGGGPEVWVEVAADQVVDWPDVWEQLNDTQRALLNGHRYTGTMTGRRPIPSRYYPNTSGKTSAANPNPPLVEDCWVFAEWITHPLWAQKVAQ
jgi:hypothetical protein